MEMRTLELPGADFSAALHSYSQGGVVSLLVCGVTMFRWAEDDYADRDVFIVAAHEMGLKGKTIALLAFTSQPTVTRVLTLAREGGRAALRERPVGGRKAVVSPALRTRLLELRKQGMAFRKIARALGLKFTVVANALKGVPAGEGPTQQFELPTPDDTHAVVDALDDASPTSHGDQDPLDHDATESPQADANDLASAALGMVPKTVRLSEFPVTSHKID